LLGLPVFRKLDVARAFEKKGLEIGRLHVATLMKKMGIGAIYGRSRSQIYSCLL